ncbi:MAG: stage II sporulation protein R [Oscillospiraceae bacterium]|nr:stage II sporulation protein R [Oscillospiraceae bacterium]
MKKIKECAALIGMAAAIFAQGVCVNAQTREEISSDVFRLHIIANSDSREDQALKIKVRDAVLEAGESIFGGSADADEAAEKTEENLGLLREKALQTIRENGFDYDAECEVAKVMFDERAYGSAVLPEGEYMALRIKIGDAEGKNWWCVMFPPLCLPAVTNTDEVLADAEKDGVLTKEELDIISDPESYQVRFYFADKFKELMEYIENNN